MGANNMLRIIPILLLLTGCAYLTESECKGDAEYWVWRGEYDAVQGDQPWIEAYAKGCSAYGAVVDEEHYLAGWDVGHADFERRVNSND